MRKTATRKTKTSRAANTARFTAAQFVEAESVLRVEGCRSRVQMVERLLADIDPAGFYEEGGHFGFGFRKSDGKLIEWNIPDKHTLEDSEASSWESEITLLESLKWVETMLFAEQRFGSCMQTGYAYAKWIEALQGALTATGKP